METGVNKVLLLGEVTTTPVEKVTAKGAWFEFRLTTIETVVKNNQQIDHFESHTIIVPFPLLKKANMVIGAGQWLYIEGHIETTKSVSVDGIKRYHTQIVACQVRNHDCWTRCGNTEQREPD